MQHIQHGRKSSSGLVIAEQRFVQMSRDALATEQALRKGIRNHEIYLDYQPKVDAVTGQLRGFEALARWPLEPKPALVLVRKRWQRTGKRSGRR